VAEGVALTSGTKIAVEYERYYPATINNAAAAEEALATAAKVAHAELAPDAAFTSEDFAFMLQVCEGAYIWLGQGTGHDDVSLHHPRYDFNDNVLATGVRLHVALAEGYLAPES
jgi:hippurate hydrolase